MDTRSRSDFFGVGLRLLAEGGIASVTIANVCARLDVTKGSFYHHFRGAPDFHRQLLEHWEQEYGTTRVAVVDSVSSPHERLSRLFEAAVERDHEAESAIRAWSRTDPIAAEVQRRLDDLRIQYVADTYEACGMPRPRAERLARLGLSALVGFQSMSQPVDRRLLREAIDEFSQLVTGAIAAAPTSGRRRAGSGPAA